MELLNGKLLSERIRAELAEKIKAFPKPVGLGVLLVGNDPASAVYVRNKIAACKSCGIVSFERRLAETATQAEVEKAVLELVNDPAVHGVLVQLPLPAHIHAEAVLRLIPAEKDVDGFTPANIGKLALNREDALIACTPAGILALLRFYRIPLRGKKVVMIGTSNIVGKPMTLLLMNEGATVTACQSKTDPLYLKALCRTADIIIVATGKPKLLTADMVNPGAVVVDVGIHRTEDGKLCGDVDFANVAPLTSFITPVPGGVGPMTIAMLLCNTYLAATMAEARA